MQREKSKLNQKTHRVKLWSFRISLVFLPIIFFCILEITLRLFNYGFPDKPLSPSQDDPQFLEIQENLGRKYFPNERISPAVSKERIWATKPKNSFRIFIFGGSTAAGYPYFYNGTFSTIVKLLLEKNFPDTFFEVINFAMTAVNSNTVVDLIKKIWVYEPDLILVYAGHNEFYGALGIGSTEFIGQSRYLIKLYLYLTEFKTFQFLQNVIWRLENILQRPLSKENAPQGTLMERIVRKKQIRYGDRLYQVAMENFKKNIDEVISETQKHSVPLILSTVSSNILDQEPFQNNFSTVTDSASWVINFHKANIFYQQKLLDSAQIYFRRCINLDTFTASPYYSLGKIANTRKEFEKSYSLFYKAKDYDALRFRASEDVNSILLDLAKKHQIPLANIKSDFEMNSPHSVPGNNLFLEHLHPNLEGYVLMGKSFYKTILKMQIISDSSQHIQIDKLTWNDFGITRLDEEIGRLRVAILTSGWPFRKDRVGSLDNVAYVPGNILEKLALQYWKNEITWEQAHVQLAEYYERTGEIDLAENEYQALIIGTPYNPSPYHRLAKLLIKQKKYKKTFFYLHKLLKYFEDIHSLRLLGSMYIDKGEFNRAIIYLEKAIKISLDDQQNLYLLAQAYSRLGDVQNENKILTKLHRLNPNHPGLKSIREKTK